MKDWRSMPPFAKLLVILTVVNTFMLTYDTDFIYHLNTFIHSL